MVKAAKIGLIFAQKSCTSCVNLSKKVSSFKIVFSQSPISPQPPILHGLSVIFVTFCSCVYLLIPPIPSFPFSLRVLILATGCASLGECRWTQLDAVG